MPAEYPDYPGHDLIARYLQNYAHHFELLPHIRFKTRITTVRPHGNRFVVGLENGSSEHFDAVIVANGHHFEPRFPDSVPGHFTGKVLHSGAYVDPLEPLELAGKRVVVVGFGNSAVDIASELSTASPRARVWLSVRRGAWVLPRYVFGRPLDQASSASMPGVPAAVRRWLLELWYRLAVGSFERFGLPRPDHALGDAHPTVSDELLPLVEQGLIEVKPAIASFDGATVRFAGGTQVEADAIVYATGYRVDFPFFDPAFIAAPDNELELFLRIFHPKHAGVYFVGLCQPLGPIFPIAEAQARLIAAHLSGKYTLPTSEQIVQRAADERARVRQRYGSSPRHTMQVDFDDYLATLARETEAGSRRSPAQH
jgi:cation diffusion facilitator CzcD-associated flavoprotein CzcO